MTEKKQRIFAVVGMAGGGKTEAIEYLREKFHWPKVYFPESLFEELEKRGLELNWENERKLREGLRAEHGKGVFAKLSLPKIQKALNQSDIVLVESMYSWEEYKIVRKVFVDAFKLIAVHASPSVRYSRLQNRKIRPIKTFKEFQERDVHEIEVTDKGGPIAVADYLVNNEGTMDQLRKQLDLIMEKEGLIKHEVEQE